MNFQKRLVTWICLMFSATALMAQQVSEPKSPAEWSAPTEPFRIAGNLYYVGTHDLACYLVATPKGHMLINTGLADSKALIARSMKQLGFEMSDIKILLTTQAHFDHVAAMAAIKKETGAKMLVNQADAAVLADGGASDYALGGTVSYLPVNADRLLRDREIITLGGTVLQMLHHPGHTKGSASYLLKTKDGKQSYTILIANMPSVVTDKPFNAIPEYPEIATDYQHTLHDMRALRFDIWVASHASQFGLHEKRKPGDRYNPARFADRAGYDAALKTLEAAVQKKLTGK
ncbi:subclass B3 metallo-beta-lactamase [Pedobacter yulinensis]|uniref:Subclass B3 metallo-beta-lactamase n=1 Tax=Pedobacter yulinensis TaxID=2126353 RepID=A0A2T3HRD7_9SPHI|nr:subclass B3 metallo-beta-lactamase [Pedobacter yulinensis]PST84961.1 subclass B3 metallo-beta-lactamase [Pedobacter yulinensis]